MTTASAQARSKTQTLAQASEAAPIAVGESDATFLASLGRRVRDARQQRGMARKVLSQTADVSERYLAQLEGGTGNASIILLRRIAAALGLQLTDLVDTDESPDEQRLIRRFLDSLPPARLEEVLRRLTAEFGQEEPVRRKRITLVGLRGAGKTTLGIALAKALRRRFVELDTEIEREAGISLSEVFLLYGQAGYRRIERRCLERVINSQEDIVLTVGGGIVSEPDTYNLLLLNCYTVWIKAAPEEHMARVVAQGDLRPMAGHAEAMEDLRNILSARESLYGKADAVVDTSGSPIETSFAALQQAIAPGA
ncbi:MAG TPA: helix-turn-helix transcriptional regulator [Steroidobacteraceae bacterium]|jgi:XRE family aerobic/anaerobic benzoate catabolism transcriptional regulator|nr:helix-turn-helix transcriptional regulator [Steroidobacteraceae bacterium]